MRRSGVQIPEAAPRKHVAGKRVLGDSTETADPVEADLPQICHRLIPVASWFSCLGGPFARLLPSRLRGLSGRLPVLPRRLSVLLLRSRVLGRRADETGTDRRREQPSARGPRLPFVPGGLQPVPPAESSESVAVVPRGNPAATVGPPARLVQRRKSSVHPRMSQVQMRHVRRVSDPAATPAWRSRGSVPVTETELLQALRRFRVSV